MAAFGSRSFRIGHSSLARLALALGAFATLGGCDKKTPEPQATAPLQPSPFLSAQAKPPSTPAPAGSAQQEPLHITWLDPPSFKRVPPSNAMRKASYVVPRAAGDPEDGELTVFYFGPGQGGSIDANVDRWVKQFADAKPGDVRRADREANGLRQHTVELDSGTFSSGMPGGSTQPKRNYGLVGGIVETPSGAYFFKLTGPANTVKQAKPEFYKLLDSIKTA
jgi:hypothetical protein